MSPTPPPFFPSENDYNCRMEQLEALAEQLAAKSVPQPQTVQTITGFMAAITHALSEFPSEVNTYGDQILATVQTVIARQLRYSAHKIEGQGEGEQDEGEGGEPCVGGGGKDGREENGAKAYRGRTGGGWEGGES